MSKSKVKFLECLHRWAIGIHNSWTGLYFQHKETFDTKEKAEAKLRELEEDTRTAI